MAEDLDDGEFWLPSQFLTDDDILMDLDLTSTESDEEISLHLSSCPLHSKGYGRVLSGSPQSTLCRCVCNQSSSRESESLSPPPPQPEETHDNTTLNLLNKAAGQVARLKLSSHNNKIGTGFFDCSQTRVSYPPPFHFQPQFLHFHPMVWASSNVVQYKYNQPKQQQNRATKSENKSNTNNNNKNNNRPLGLPLSAWPPLQAQSQAQAQKKTPVQSQPQITPQKLTPLFVGPPKGTGVFLPRRVATTPANEARNKSDGNSNKSKNGKGCESKWNNNRRNSSGNNKASTASDNDVQLPQEWAY